MKVIFTLKVVLISAFALNILISPLSAVVLLRSSSLPKKRVKKRLKYPQMDMAHAESDKLRINGFRMNPTDADRIFKEGRNLKVECKYFLFYIYTRN